MDPFCFNCYNPNAKKWCGKCKRHYGSRECQLEDWRQKGHKIWCGKAGEMGTDYEIKESAEKNGVGIFALRNFEEGADIVIEAPLFTASRYKTPEFPAEVVHAMEPLWPRAGTPDEKFRLNACGVSHNSAELSLCVAISRANHECAGNAFVKSDETGPCRVNRLRAIRHIAKGEEVTYAYLAAFPTAEVREKVQTGYQFTCKCSLCRNPDLAQELEDLKVRLDGLVAVRKGPQALKMYKRLLEKATAASVHPLVIYELYTAAVTLSSLTGRTEDSKELAIKAAERSKIWADQRTSLFFESIIMDPTQNPTQLLSQLESSPVGGSETQKHTFAMDSQQFAAKPFCAVCYTPRHNGESLVHCKCSRIYCSKDCEQTDMRKNNHEHWCGRVGQLGKDIELKDAPDKTGIGIFALRDFDVGSIVIAEAPIVILNDGLGETLMQSERESIVIINESLHPKGGTLEEKLENNVIRWAGQAGLFPTICRMNHSCIGNVRPYLRKNLMLMKCIRPITAGEEFTYPYTLVQRGGTTSERRAKLRKKYGFTCNCPSCSNAENGRKLETAWRLYNRLCDAGRQRNLKEVEKLSKQVLPLLVELKWPPACIGNVYATLFQTNIFHPRPDLLTSTLQDHARESARYLRMWFEDQTDHWNVWNTLAEKPSRFLEPDVQEKFKKGAKAGHSLL